ncbi:hypothetical protein [Serratia sp. JSRIV004]|uniref:hypothetical protein n=1 Tax=Serratia sp. JSRIV004 TaxID=2831895 RepID=UPI001CBE39A8|nr:hypothetical protein [Serratia sp. JSRIV004]UAN55472.1 hypothetical protein KGP21_17405 [Serratia sp. JSRIV004]UAN57285.1 hypothetical protein KGP21_27430 [Serratia sp. JSRIV004]
MTIILKITIQENKTGVNTNSYAEGPCTTAESGQAKFIYNTIVGALSNQPGYKNSGEDVCKTIHINRSNDNVH